ncbi:MAG: DEAD/DEAH box helicase [Chloroflexota bacterium]
MRTYAPASTLAVLEQILEEPSLARGVVHHEVRPATEPKHADWPAWLDPRLRAGLAKRGIERPYLHQADAIEAVHEGKDIVVVTPTASGKSLCYTVPVLQALAEDPSARALFLFPTKALAQDQVAEISELVRDAELEVSSAAYDGDTPAPIRSAIRKAGQIVVTNPDMLHSAILPHHTKWFQLFEQVRVIVIDELHMYRGVFGSHVANVLRRLLRLCAHYGSHPVIVCCSATIGNPAELAEAITGRPVASWTATARRRARSTWSSWTARDRCVHGRALQRRPSRNAGRSLPPRRPADRRLRQEPESGWRSCSATCASGLRMDLEPRSRLRGYRGRYLPTERRSIRRGLRDGEVLGVVSTSALELGVDIGRLDVAILAGYPGSIAATWQQMGRAGRRGDVSVAVLVASPTPRRPVRDPPPGVRAGRPARGGAPGPGQPPRAARPHPVRCLRAAVRARRSGLARAQRTTCSRSSARAGRCARRMTGAGTGARRTSRPRRSRCALRRRRTW